MKKAVIEISVSPKSSRSKITINDSGDIKIFLNSPPVDGKANAELVKLLSRAVGIAKTSIEIIKGKNSRKKILSINGIDRNEVLDKLKKL